MKLFLFCFICFLQAVPALAKEVSGSIQDDLIYGDIVDNSEFDGQLNLLIYEVYPGVLSEDEYRYGLRDFLIRINQIEIATLHGSYFKSLGQSGSFEYLNIYLPTGKYTGELLNKAGIFTPLAITGQNSIEFVIKKDKSLTLIIERLRYGDNFTTRILNQEKLPEYLGKSKLYPRPTKSINQNNYKIVRNIMSQQVEEFINGGLKDLEEARFIKAEEDEAKKIAKENIEKENEKQRFIQSQKDESDKVAKEKMARDSFVISELQKGINKIEQEERIKSLKVEEEERIKYKQAEDDQKIIKAKELIANEDDATCKSFGAKFGTEPYINCRIAFTKSRQEKEDIEIKNKEILTNIDSIKRQADIQQSQRQAEARASEERRVNELQLYQQQLAEEKKRRDRADNLDRSQRWFDLAYKFSQPTQGSVPATSPRLQ